MKDFAYYAPQSLAEATTLLVQHAGQAKVLAGGTDIIVQLREGLREAEVVVDIKHIPELMELQFSPTTGLQLGASVPCYRVYQNEALKQAYPALTDAAHIIGGWQIQSRASIGGNLCNASPAADSIPALMVHQAVAMIVGPNGTRAIPVADFCSAPARNVLQAGEMVVRLELPAPTAHAASSYERFIPRNEMDIAVVGAAAWVKLNAAGNLIEDCHIALGAVAPTPKSATAAAQSLLGQSPAESHFTAAGELAKQVASPITDMRGSAEYRLHLVGVLVKRTLMQAVQRARGC